MTAATTRKSLSKIKDSTSYYPHQISGVREMCRMGNVLLADEMGLGKSLEALTVAAVDHDIGVADRILVVAPATLKWNWLMEIEIHTLFTAHVLDGSMKIRGEQIDQYVDDGTDILIVNYEQVKPHLRRLNEVGFQVCIMDEAHYIKSFKSQRSQACQALRAKRFLLLTGSPMLNQVNELWSLLYRLQPTKWPKYYSFVSRFCVYGGYKDKQIVGTKNQAELSERLKDVMVRRLKKDVLDLPDKQHIQVWVDLSPDQRKLYKQAIEEMAIDLPDTPDQMELENALVKFLRLKQICGTTATIPGYEDHSYKLDRAVEMVQEIVEQEPHEHLVVFTQFRGVLAAFGDRLDKIGIHHHDLHGDVAMKDRAGLVTKWGNTKPNVLISMLQVGGTGLTMTKANKCIFLDKLFVPKMNEQAEDRLHRIGADLTKPIQIFELLTKGTIEQRIEQILKTKRIVFDTIVETSDWKRKLYAALRESEL